MVARVRCKLAVEDGGGRTAEPMKKQTKLWQRERCVFTRDTPDVLRTQAGKAKYFARPANVPRYMDGPLDGRGLMKPVPLDGTNKAESVFNTVEQTFSASAYEKWYGHSLLMASAERASVKGHVAAGMQKSVGHVDMQLCRLNKLVAKRFSLPVDPHPSIPLLSTDTGERFGVEYAEEAEMRLKGTTPQFKEIKPPSFEDLFSTAWTHDFAEEDEAARQASTGPRARTKKAKQDAVDAVVAAHPDLFNIPPDLSFVLKGWHPRNNLCQVGGDCCKKFPDGRPANCHLKGLGPNKHQPGGHKHVEGCRHGVAMGWWKLLQKKLQEAEQEAPVVVEEEEDTGAGIGVV